MKKFKKEIVFGLIFFLITVFLFHDYLFKGLIPFPANLLVTFFAPWDTMTFSGWEHGIPNKPMGIDNLNLFYPYKDLSISLLTTGILPLWNPYNFTGNVLLANFQSSIFYPLNFLYFLLPTIDTWSLLVIIQPLLAGVFTYLFLMCFSLRKFSAFFGALVFAFSGEMIVWMEDHLVVSHTILWLPLILFGIESFLTKGRWYFYAISIIGLVFSFFAGFFQPFFYVALVSLLFFMFRLKTGNYEGISKKQIILGISIFVLSFGLSMVQFLPSLEALLQSPRNTADVKYLYDTFLMPPGHLISLLAPDYSGNPGAYNFFGKGAYHESVLYIGIIPLMFVLLSLKSFKREIPVRFFWLLTIITLLLGINLPFVRWLFDLKIPILYTFLPSRIFFINTFIISILSAFGLNEWLKNREQKISFRILFSFLILLLVLFLYSFAIQQGNVQLLYINQFIFRLQVLSSANARILERNLIVPLATILISIFLFRMDSFKKLTSLILPGIFIITILGQLYFAQKYLFFSDREFLYPLHPVFNFIKENAGENRFWTYGDGYITANFATFFRVFSPDGTDALFSSRLGELYYATETKGKLTTDIPRIDARIARAGEGEKMTDNPYRLRILSLVGAKYITDWTRFPENENEREKKFPANLFNLIWEKDSWKIYEFKNVLPRAFITDSYIKEENKQKILDRIFDSSYDLSTIILEESPQIEITPSGFLSRASILSYKPNNVTIDVQTNKNALLFLSDSYFNGWNAYIDGVKSKVFRADYAFRAVVIPKGAKRVIFSYEPESLKWGAGITIISLSIFVALLLLISKNEKKANYEKNKN